MKMLYQPFDLTTLDLVPGQEWRAANAGFFELLFIEEGTGEQHLDDAVRPYTSGQVLLVLPEQRLRLRATAPGRVQCVQFHPIYFARTDIQGYAFNYGEWLRKLEILFHTGAGSADGQPLLAAGTADEPTLRWLLQVLVREYQGAQAYCDVVVQNTLFSVLTILARHRAFPLAGTETRHVPRPQQLLDYIHFHIYQPAQLTVAHLAAEFAVAPTYFSEFFRREFGLSYKQYVLRYKLQLVKNRLAFTDQTLAQIADEVGFADVAHLRKAFRKQWQVAPGECKLALHEARRTEVATQ